MSNNELQEAIDSIINYLSSNPTSQEKAYSEMILLIKEQVNRATQKEEA